MTAYELADAIEDWETGANYTVSIKAAQMLRQLQKEKEQQTDRIATLENQLDKYSHYEAMTHQEYMQQIMQLEKEKIRAYNNGYEDGWKSNTQLHPLNDEEIPILTILQSAHSVRLGDAIYESDAEYEKLKKIVVAAVKWTQERILGK